MKTRPLLLTLAATLSVSAILSSTLSAKPKPAPVPANSEIVELPTYTVTDSRVLPPPESWRYAALPGYEILSDGTERATKRFLDEFQLFGIGIKLIWPDIVLAKPSVPTLIILCAQNSFKPFIPPNPDPEAYITTTSLFVEDKERGAIVIDFSTNEIFDSTSNLTYVVDPYKEFYRQYTRFLMRRANGNKPIPAWLETGLSQLFTTVDIDKKSIEMGKLSNEGFKPGKYTDDGSFATDSNEELVTPYVIGPASYGPQNSWANERFGFDRLNSMPDKSVGLNATPPPTRYQTAAWVFPIQGLFDSGSEYYQNSDWNRECYAFVHMCLYGMQKKYQQAFVDLAKLACAGPVTENDFKKCFGASYAQMTKVLQSYVSTPSHQYVHLQTKRGSAPIPQPQAISLRDATDAEVGRIKGETLRLAGYAGDSRDALIAPYIRKHADASLLASLGLLETLDNRKDRARKFLEAAAKENVVRPRAYLELARLRLDEALAAPKGENGKLDAAQTFNVLDPLFTARSQQPPMADVYGLIGETWKRSAIQPSGPQLKVLLEGTVIFPTNTKLIFQAAELFAQIGDTQATQNLTKLGLTVSRNTDMRQKFEALRTTHSPAP